MLGVVWEQEAGEAGVGIVGEHGSDDVSGGRCRLSLTGRSKGLAFGTSEMAARRVLKEESCCVTVGCYKSISLRDLLTQALGVEGTREAAGRPGRKPLQ